MGRFGPRRGRAACQRDHGRGDGVVVRPLFPRRSSDLTSAYALLVEPTEKYINQKTHPQKHFVPGARAASNVKLCFNLGSPAV